MSEAELRVFDDLNFHLLVLGKWFWDVLHEIGFHGIIVAVHWFLLLRLLILIVGDWVGRELVGIVEIREVGFVGEFGEFGFADEVVGAFDGLLVGSDLSGGGVLGEIG